MVKITERLAEADQSTEWPTIELDTPEVKIYSRPPKEFPTAEEKMLLTITRVEANIEKVFTLSSNTEGYRQKWDDLLEKQEVVTKLNDNTWITHSYVKKKLILSARDAVEVLQVKRRDDGVIIMGLQGIDYPERPPTKNYVRTKQFISGTYLKPVGDNCTEFRHVLAADLNLPVPKLMASMAASFKPKLISESLGSLKKAAKTINVN
ncbi:unnamed protein product [Bursaphelenchus okinawaensis]|uniref:START domain-containing protein n=1 Tax=Bursaphelenchus okinawaensis TaxID=465554 RepID=A0A811KZD3_9BILA|nr:unnamed protein product [Bursaphelenchus okinawaensis]CAG9114168.1 unnamed protein product [Bursaphelenchus okinawaensis]